MKYLSFPSPWEHHKEEKRSFIEKFLQMILPVANPDFDDKIKDVYFWMVEFDDEGIPIREIGLDQNKKVILKMPYQRNYGFWTDNNMQYDDFKTDFSTQDIDGKQFNDEWKSLKL